MVFLIAAGHLWRDCAVNNLPCEWSAVLRQLSHGFVDPFHRHAPFANDKKHGVGMSTQAKCVTRRQDGRSVDQDYIEVAAKPIENGRGSRIVHERSEPSHGSATLQNKQTLTFGDPHSLRSG